MTSTILSSTREADECMALDRPTKATYNAVPLSLSPAAFAFAVGVAFGVVGIELLASWPWARSRLITGGGATNHLFVFYSAHDC